MLNFLAIVLIILILFFIVIFKRKYISNAFNKKKLYLRQEIHNKNHKIEGLDAVIDKDFSAAKMARIIRAQELWIISDIEYLYRNFCKENAIPIKQIYTEELRKLYTKNIF